MALPTSLPTFETLLYDVQDGIATVTLHRPEKMNAFTTQMRDDLVAVFDETDKNDDVRVVIITGAGKAFCAGAELSAGGKTFDYDSRGESARDKYKVNGIYRDGGGIATLRIFKSLKPVIGAINGAAVGIGATMTLPMDIRLASDKARIGFVFGKIGVVPEACSTWFLPRIVGLQQAMDWVYSADILTAEQALAGRLVKAVVPAEQLLAEAHALAHKYIDHRSPVSIALMRQMLLRNHAMPHPRDAHAVESLAMLHTSRHDGKEGVASFNEKRTPAYTGRASDGLGDFYPWW